MANILSISPNRSKFLPSVCLVQAGRPVSISAVSLRKLSSCIDLLKLILIYRRWQRINLAAFVFVPSLFFEGGEVYNDWILNDMGRNSLLGNRKKIANVLMRTFTCRSTFLYVVDSHWLFLPETPCFLVSAEWFEIPKLSWKHNIVI